jgi:Flp pilus assembly protein TadD
VIRWVLVGLIALGSCKAQGDYTRAAEEEARASMNALRAGTDYDQALRQLKTGDLDRALKTIDRCISRVPGVDKSILLRAKVLIELGELSKAFAALDGKVSPGDYQFPYLRGIVEEQRGEFEAALNEYGVALLLSPGRPEIILAMAEVMVPLGQIDGARALLDVEDGQLASHPGFRQSLGHLSMLQGDLQGAEALFLEASLLKPRDPVILEDLARARVALAKFDEALDTLMHLKALPDANDLRHLEAHCLVQTRHPVEARALLMTLTADPASPHGYELWKLLADTALMLEDDRLLRSAADRLLQAGPMRPEGYVILALWKRRSGDLEGALQSVRQAVTRAGDDPAPKQLEELLQRDLGEAGG